MTRLITIINIPAVAFMLLPGPSAAIERPLIGTEAYSAGCVIEQAWEDGSAIAFCPEDGVRYVYDPDGNAWPASGNPVHDLGWYVCKDADCTDVAYDGS